MFLLKLFKRSSNNSAREGSDARKLQSQSCSPRAYNIENQLDNNEEEADAAENREGPLKKSNFKEEMKREFLEGFDLSPVAEKKTSAPNSAIEKNLEISDSNPQVFGEADELALKSRSVDESNTNPPLNAEALQNMQSIDKINISSEKKSGKKKKKDKSVPPRGNSGLPPHQKKKRKSSKKRKKTKDQKDKSRITGDNSLISGAAPSEREGEHEINLEAEIANAKKENSNEVLPEAGLGQADNVGTEPKESANAINLSGQGNALGMVVKSEPANGLIRGRSKKKVEQKTKKITALRSHSFSKEVTVVAQGGKARPEEDMVGKLKKKNMGEAKKASVRPLPKINSAKARQERAWGYPSKPPYLNSNNLSLNYEIASEPVQNLSSNKIIRDLNEQSNRFEADDNKGKENDDIFERIDKILRRSAAYPQKLKNNFEKSLLKLYNLESSNLMRKDKILDKVAKIEQNFERKKAGKKKNEDNWELEEFNEEEENEKARSLTPIGREKNNYVDNAEEANKSNRDSDPASLTVINEEHFGESGNWDKVTMNANRNIKQTKTSFTREVKKIEDLQTRNFNALSSYLNIKENLLDINMKMMKGPAANK